MKRPIRLIIFVCIIIVLLAVVRVTLENSISTTGAELVNLQNKLSGYKKSNALLEEKYLEKSSLTYISKKAKDKGYVFLANQIYFSAPLPLALNQ